MFIEPNLSPPSGLDSQSLLNPKIKIKLLRK